MPTINVQIPALGESVSEATLIKWHKNDGDLVKTDEPICELETDKANVDMPSPGNGVIKRLKKEGEKVRIGETIATLDPSAKPSAPPAPAVSEDGTRREKISKIRKRIAENLVRAQQTAAILTTFNEIDLSNIIDIRSKYKERFEKVHGVGLGFMSFFARAAVLALKEFERVNAQIEGDDVIYHDYVHLGIAVSTDRGLAVPVLRHAEKMSFAKIEMEIKRLAAATRDGKLSLQELSGGTFTITNGGVFGSLLSTPILNPPQSGILGMHAIQKRAVVINDKVEIRPMIYVALSYDHRPLDGD